jgi:hypothetical protein
MHLEFCIEDQSGALFLEAMLPKLITNPDVTWRVHSYKGVGRMPRKQPNVSTIKARMLLDNLSKIISGMAKTPGIDALIVIMDADNRNCVELKNELVALWKGIAPKFNAIFRIAVEEMEAWYLGDQAAIRASYPGTKEGALTGYTQDSVCGTWERLADAIEHGGAAALRMAGWPAPGVAKCRWAETITPHMNPHANASPSFVAFRNKVLELAAKN